MCVSSRKRIGVTSLLTADGRKGPARRNNTRLGESERVLFVTKMTSGNVEWREAPLAGACGWEESRLSLWATATGKQRGRGRLVSDKKSMLQHTLALVESSLARHTNLLIVQPVPWIHFSKRLACSFSRLVYISPLFSITIKFEWFGLILFLLVCKQKWN